MKKILGFLLVCGLSITLVTGCGIEDDNQGNNQEGSNTSESEKVNIDIKTSSISDILAGIYSNINDELPMMGEIPVTGDNMSYYIGIDNLDIKEGIASEPMMSSIAYSLVVLRVGDNVDIEKAKSDIKTNVDPRKWICVEADSVIVDSREDVIVLIMTNTDSHGNLGEKIQKSFNKL